MQRVLLFAALAILFSFYANEIWRSFKSSHPPQIHAHQERPQYEAKHDNIFSDGWNWTTQDPVSFYTFLLAISPLLSYSYPPFKFVS